MNNNEHTATIQRCINYYENTYSSELNRLKSPPSALDECIQHFLEQRPANKKLSNKDRAKAFASSSFVRNIEAVTSSQRMSLALSKLLHYDDAIHLEQLDHLATNTPDVLRWAIRYAKLFTRDKSPLWTHLRSTRKEDHWTQFFYVCEQLTEVIKPFQKMIDNIENQLSPLSVIDYFSYLSVLSYESISQEEQTDRNFDIYQRIISRKLHKCFDNDFQITEEDIGKSLQTHLSPILFSPPTKYTEENIKLFSELIYATGELIDYEGSIDWFCFDENCGYTDEPFKSVICNISDKKNLEWSNTNNKLRLLWNYWMTRGINEFISRGLHIQKIGLVENNELNKLAFIKAIRSELMLKEVYGFSDTIETNSGIHINTFMFMLFAELTSVFFQNDFIDEFKILYKNTGCTYKSLSMLAFNGILNGMQNRFPMTWAKIDDKINKLTCWSVNETFPNGNEIITRAIIETWSVDLKSLNNNPSLIPRLNERPYYKIGNYLFQFPWVMGLQNNAHSAINNFRRIGNKRTGLLNETRQIEKNIADQLRLKNISVVCGYQPERSENEDPGEIDIIAYADGILLLIEVKSGYIRSSKKEAWLHKNGALRKASWQLQRKSIAVKEALLSDEHLREQLNLTNKETHQTFKSWIIDTSLEFDGQSIDGYFVTSLETLLIALRDEKSMLLDIDKTNEDIPRNGSLYRDSFTMREFIDIIEFGKVWHGLI